MRTRTVRVLLGEDELPLAGDPQAILLPAMHQPNLVATREPSRHFNGEGHIRDGLLRARFGCSFLDHARNLMRLSLNCKHRCEISHKSWQDAPGFQLSLQFRIDTGHLTRAGRAFATGSGARRPESQPSHGFARGQLCAGAVAGCEQPIDLMNVKHRQTLHWIEHKPA